MSAQKAGIQHTGKLILEKDIRPFEHLVTLAYTRQIERDDAKDAKSYEKFIDSL